MLLCVCSLEQTLKGDKSFSMKGKKVSSKCQKPIKGLRNLGDQCLALLYELFSELRPGFYLCLSLELSHMMKGRCVYLTLMNSESDTCISKFLDLRVLEAEYLGR